MEPGDDDKMLFEVDAPGVHPTNVATVAFLEAAASYFVLAEQSARKSGFDDFRIFGVEIIDKCAAVVAHVSSPNEALVIARNIRGILSGHDVPHGYQTAVSRLRRAMSSLSDHTARARIGSTVVELPTSLSDRMRPPYSTVTLRAKLVRVGGADPVARFEAIGEEPFSLSVPDQMTARELASHLYGELDIEAFVSRDEDDRIDGGRLHGFEPVAALEPGEASTQWRDWFRTSGIDWDTAIRLEDERDEDSD